MNRFAKRLMKISEEVVNSNLNNNNYREVVKKCLDDYVKYGREFYNLLENFGKGLKNGRNNLIDFVRNYDDLSGDIDIGTYFKRFNEGFDDMMNGYHSVELHLNKLMGSLNNGFSYVHSVEHYFSTYENGEPLYAEDDIERIIREVAKNLLGFIGGVISEFRYYNDMVSWLLNQLYSNDEYIVGDIIDDDNLSDSVYIQFEKYSDILNSEYDILSKSRDKVQHYYYGEWWSKIFSPSRKLLDLLR